MKITLDIPDNIATQLADSCETLTRRFLELLAVEAYRKGWINMGEAIEQLQQTNFRTSSTLLQTLRQNYSSRINLRQ